MNNLIDDYNKAFRFYTKTKNKEALNEFVSLSYKLCAQHKIANFRIAIKGNEIMLIVGMRCVLNFKENKQDSFIGIMINTLFLDHISNKENDVHYYKGEDKKCFIRLNYQEFINQKKSIINHVEPLVVNALQTIKGHGKEFWNTTSFTTNYSFKQIINDKLEIETFFTNENISFQNLKELVNIINSKLGSFRNVFQETRKELLGKKRKNSTKSLFVLNDSSRDWAINEGGGIELQYHLFLRNNTIGYGLGFNTQYVPFANELSSVEYMQPYINSFLAQKETQNNLSNNGFEYIIGSKKQLENITNDDYILIGKEIKLENNEPNYKIHSVYLNQVIYDLKNELFDTYKQIISNLNNYLNYSSEMQNIIDILQHKKQIILQGPPGTGKTRLAKQIAKEMTTDEKDYKIIQFHPSYTYEDFVRGITVKNNAEGQIEYKTENKVLAEFAEKALENLSSQDVESKPNNLNIVKSFSNLVIDEISKNGEFYISDNIYIFYVDDKRFKYKGANWTAHPNGLNMNFSEIVKILDLNLIERKEIVESQELNALTKSHASYYQKLINKINESDLEKLSSISSSEKKNYVLIIDEINRANLSSVLGELIYALEYRGEAVESMYAIDGDNKIILPENLYIIGTMNTADRSVGQIDYAIRRRFAFVDVLPQDLTNKLEEGYNFATDKFNEVAQLFDNHLSEEFEKKDVQLGHSYFIYQDNFEIKLDYEIKPILLEYVKDGILKESAKEEIEKL